MGSKRYLSFQAQKFVGWLTCAFAVLFAAMAFWNWSTLALWESRLISGEKHYPLHFALFTLMASVLAGDAAASGVALLCDFITRRGKFDPEVRRVAKLANNLGFPDVENPQPHPPVTPEELGPVFLSHRFAKPARRFILWALAVVLLLPTMMLACAALGEFPVNVLGPMGAVALLYVIYLLLRAKPVGKTLQVRRDGVEWTAGKEAHAYRWRDIVGLRESITDFPKQRQRVHGCTIKASDGRQMHFSNVEPRTGATFAPIVEILHQQSSALLMPRFLGLLQSQIPVNFGPVSIDAARLYFGVRSVARVEIEKVTVEHGQVAIYRSGESVSFAAFGWDTVWNPWVLLALLGTLPPSLPMLATTQHQF